MKIDPGTAKFLRYFSTFLLGITLGGSAGLFLAKQAVRISIASGPYSDYYGSARHEIQMAMDELKRGNTDIAGHLETADLYIKKSQEWTKRFLSRSDGARP